MFSLDALKEFTDAPDARIIVEGEPKIYSLCKIDQGESWEIRMDEKVDYIQFNRHTIRHDTILRFFISKKDDLFDTLYTILRNCLLVERINK